MISFNERREIRLDDGGVGIRHQGLYQPSDWVGPPPVVGDRVSLIDETGEWRQYQVVERTLTGAGAIIDLLVERRIRTQAEESPLTAAEQEEE